MTLSSGMAIRPVDGRCGRRGRSQPRPFCHVIALSRGLSSRWPAALPGYVSNSMRGPIARVFGGLRMRRASWHLTALRFGQRALPLYHTAAIRAAIRGETEAL